MFLGGGGVIRYVLTPTPPPVVSYTGPGDIVSGAFGWWGLRAYTSATIGNNLIRLREDGGDTESNFASIAGGGFDLAAIAAFKGAANLFVTKLYDQSGNGHDYVQATAGSQPSFQLSILGALPAIVGVAGKFMIQSPTVAISNPYSHAHVVQSPSVGSTRSELYLDGNPQAAFNIFNSNKYEIYNGAAVSAPTTTSTWYAIGEYWNNTGPVTTIYMNGSSAASGSPGSVASALLQYLFYDTANPLLSSWMESMVYQSDISASFSSLSTNQQTYYGF